MTVLKEIVPYRRQQYSTDRLIQSKRDDILGRVRFAGDLSKDIQSWQGRGALVIALDGAWGCGKTFVKNMLFEANSRGRKKANSFFWKPSAFDAIEVPENLPNKLKAQ